MIYCNVDSCASIVEPNELTCTTHSQQIKLNSGQVCCVTDAKKIIRRWFHTNKEFIQDMNFSVVEMLHPEIYDLMVFIITH